MDDDSLIQQFVEILLPTPDSFLKVKETLTRIGVASKRDKILFQSCHILHKKGRYFITHFKQMFALDGKFSDISENDLGRLHSIAKLLQDWGLVKLVNPKQVEFPVANLSAIKIIAYKDKPSWDLQAKYSIGFTKNSY